MCILVDQVIQADFSSVSFSRWCSLQEAETADSRASRTAARRKKNAQRSAWPLQSGPNVASEISAVLDRQSSAEIRLPPMKRRIPHERIEPTPLHDHFGKLQRPVEHLLASAFLLGFLLELLGRPILDVLPGDHGSVAHLLLLVLRSLAPELSRHQQVRRTPQPGDLVLGFLEQLLLSLDILDRVRRHVFELQPQLNRLVHGFCRAAP